MNANPYANQSAYRGGPSAAPGQILYRAGHPYRFMATKPFVLGQTGVQVRAGTEILFDGTKATVDGAEYNLPYLRGAVRAGWMVLAEEYDPNDPIHLRRQSANIMVRHATQGGNPMNPQQRMAIATTESDEREVGNTRQHAMRTASQNRGYVRGQTPVNVVEPGTLVRTQRGVMEVEVQDGVEVPNRFLQTPAGERSKQQRLDLTSEDAARALHLAKNVAIQPGEGQSEEEMLAKMDDFEREEYLAKKEALRAQYVDEGPQPTPPIARPQGQRVVARVQGKRNGHQEGMAFTNSVGQGSLSIGDQTDGEVIGQVHPQDDIQQFEQEGIRFTTTNGPRRPQQKQAAVRQPLVASAEVPPPVPAHLDVRRQIAKALCPEFPDNYDFNLSPKKKLARLQADYEDRQDILRAVFAAEGDDFKALLVQEFPQAFQA